MATIVTAIYQDGVLRPTTQLDLPEGIAVQVQITPVSDAPAESNAFGSLAGIWSHLSQADLEQIDRAIGEIRQQASDKMERLARQLD